MQAENRSAQLCGNFGRTPRSLFKAKVRIQPDRFFKARRNLLHKLHKNMIPPYSARRISPSLPTKMP